MIFRIAFLVGMIASFILMQVTGQMIFFYAGLGIVFLLILMFNSEEKDR